MNRYVKALKSFAETELPEGSVFVCVVQVPGLKTEIVTSVDDRKDLAAGLRSVANKLSTDA